MMKCTCTAHASSGTAVLEPAPSPDCPIHGNHKNENNSSEHSGDSCGCGHSHEAHEHEHTHEHSHEQSGASCGCSGHSHTHDDGCGCGHDHGNRDKSTIRFDLFSVGAAIAVAAVALLFTSGVLETILLLGAVLIAGVPIMWQGLKSIAKLDFEEMALMTIAVIAACILREYVEALMVTLFFRVGQILEDVAVAKGRRDVEAVTKIIPENANLITSAGAVTVAAETLAVGSHILVKSGERLPVDAVVLTGTSSLDTSSLTGESTPREVQPGDVVLSGAINLGGALTCETTSSFQNSTASKIIEMVKESSAQKGKTEKLISRFARIYTPIVMAVAVLVAVLPPVLGFGEFSDWIMRALVFLVASCPCALVISVPLSFFAGIGATSRQGVLVKGTKYLEILAKADTVVFDKTGTLTTGHLSVDEVTPVPGAEKEEILRLAAICESYSNHPIAKAVVEAWGTPDTTGVERCEEITSYGMAATVGEDNILCGSARFMAREGIPTQGLPDANVYVAKNGGILGAISVSDSPREEAAQAILELKKEGVSKVAMLTGDSEAAAKKVASALGLDEAAANLLPQDKVERFRNMKQQAAGPALFVGDGINDSPVLASADAGIAVGFAADAAIEAADVVLLSNKLTSLPQAMRIARRTTRLAHFNISFALGVKLLVFVLAFLGIASMPIAVFADVGVTVLAVLNATRALRFR